MNNKEEVSLKKMDEIKDFDFDINVDISQIILKAENIKTNRKDKKELLLFLGSSLLIVSLVLYLGVFAGAQNLIIYFEIFFFALAPLLIIPAAVAARVKER